uniref:Uncharacterized protein n=1 Tax=Virgibacillus oceani TaxID=1479511 RepID=A0A917H0X3_9BACI|nr:hypothetical protein GCM10011398_04370 [Virgibacillus oceani]
MDAIPSISKTTPIETIINTINIPVTHTTSLNIDDDITEKIAASTKVITAMVKLNLIDLFMCDFILYLK